MSTEFKVGDKITYYDAATDSFVSREVAFIHEGWAVVFREAGGRCPLALAALEQAHPHRGDPILPGCKVRSQYGVSGTVVAVDGLSAWVRDDADEQGGHVAALSTLMHA